MKGLFNPSGNFLVIEDVNQTSVRGFLYKDETQYDNFGAWDTKHEFAFTPQGQREALETTKGSGTTFAQTTNQDICYNLIVTLSADSPERFSVRIPGEADAIGPWTVEDPTAVGV